MFPITLNAMSTVKNFPKPPAGLNMASISPPTEKLVYASDQEVELSMAAPAAAPNNWIHVFAYTNSVDYLNRKPRYNTYNREEKTQECVDEYTFAARKMPVRFEFRKLSFEKTDLGPSGRM
jgi:hypothetical protein